MKTSTAGSVGDKGRLKGKAQKWPNIQQQRSWSAEVPARHGWKQPERSASPTSQPSPQVFCGFPAKSQAPLLHCSPTWARPCPNTKAQLCTSVCVRELSLPVFGNLPSLCFHPLILGPRPRDLTEQVQSCFPEAALRNAPIPQRL